MNLGDTENPYRIEPSKLDSIPSSLNDLIAELASSTAALGQKLHPKTASNLADLVRLMNCWMRILILMKIGVISKLKQPHIFVLKD